MMLPINSARGWPTQRRRAGSGVAVLPRLARLAEIEAAGPDQGAVRHLDAAEAVLAAERDAAAELLEGCTHPALRIGGVREPAERAGLGFGRVGAPRVAEAALVLLPATIDVALRKEDVAPEVVEARELGH
jgi:hypothetical protein